MSSLFKGNNGIFLLFPVAENVMNSRKGQAFLFPFFLCFFFFLFFFRPPEGFARTRLVKILYTPSVLSEVNQNDGKVALRSYIALVAEEAGLELDLEVDCIGDQDLLVKLIQTEAVDFIILVPEEFCRLAARVPLLPEWVGTRNDKTHESYLFLVRQDSGLQSISDLQRQAVCLDVSPPGKIGLYWLDLFLADAKKPRIDQYFSKVTRVQNSQKVVLPVFFKQAQGCMVRTGNFETLKELNPQLSKELQVIASSPEFLIGMTAFREGFDPDLKKKLADSAFRLHTSVKGRQILTLLRINKILPYEEGHLTSTQRLLSDHQGLK